MVTTKDNSWMQVSAETHQPETQRLLNHDQLVEIALTSLDDLESDKPREAVVAIDPEVATPSATLSTATSSEPTLQVQELQKARVAASGTACCILGCLLAGPIAAIAAGFGAAYAAEHKQGPVGDVVRAVGDVALAARDKAREVDEKHHVVDSSKQAASEAWEKAKEMNRNHHICESTKNIVVSTTRSVIHFAIRHRLVERSVEGVGRGMEYIGKKLTSDTPAVPTAAEE